MICILFGPQIGRPGSPRRDQDQHLSMAAQVGGNYYVITLFLGSFS